MNRIPLGRVIVLAGTLCLALSVPAMAQGRRAPGRQEVERQIQQRFAERVRRELGLTREEGRTLNQAIATFQKERQKLARRDLALRQRLRSTGSLLSVQEARDVLEEMARVQEEEADLLRREQAALLEVLSPPQVVRFYTLRAEMAERVRRLQGGPPGRRDGGGVGGGTMRPGSGFL